MQVTAVAVPALLLGRRYPAPCLRREGSHQSAEQGGASLCSSALRVRWIYSRRPTGRRSGSPRRTVRRSGSPRPAVRRSSLRNVGRCPASAGGAPSVSRPARTVCRRTREFRTNARAKCGKSQTGRPISRGGLDQLTALPAPPRRAWGCLACGAAASLAPVPASARTTVTPHDVRGGAQNRELRLALLRNGGKEPALARRRPPEEASARRKVEGAADDDMAAGSGGDQGDGAETCSPSLRCRTRAVGSGRRVKRGRCACGAL
jgi:hypothetical protein